MHKQILFSKTVHPFTRHFRVSVCVCVCLGEHNSKYSHTRSTEPWANNKTTLNCVQQVTALLHHNYNLSDEEILLWSILMSLNVLKCKL